MQTSQQTDVTKMK